jgi:hypothetical protein
MEAPLDTGRLAVLGHPPRKPAQLLFATAYHFATGAISARVRQVRQEAADVVATMTVQPMAAPWVVAV